MRLKAGLRNEREYFKQQPTGCRTDRFLLSRASKLESVCDKDLHALKRGAEEIPQDLLRKG